MKKIYNEFASVIDQLSMIKSNSEEVVKVKEAGAFYFDLIEKAERTKTANKEFESLISEFIDIARELIEKEKA